MSTGKTVHLLICSESQQDAEYYSNLLRGGGLATRVHRVTSAKDLSDSLNDTSWELLLATDSHPELSPVQVLALAGKSGSDVPVVISLGNPDSATLAELLENGARDVIARDDGDRLLHAIKREFDGLLRHRQLKELEVAYEETARRAELLLKTAQDAIAYVTDGMHIHVNEVYAQLFAYDDVDEFAGIPLVDLIAPDNQQDFKDALRRYRDHPEEETDISITGIRSDEGQFPATLVLSTASYEGESCMQVLVRAAAAPAVAASNGEQGPSGIDALTAMIAAARATGTDCHFALIGIDDFNTQAGILGLSYADTLSAGINSWLTEKIDWLLPPVRFGQEYFAAVARDTDTDTCLKTATELTQALSGQIHEVGERSVQVSGCVSIAKVDEQSSSLDPTTIIDAAWASLHEMRQAVSAPGGNSQTRAMAALLATPGSEDVASSEGDASDVLEQAIEAEEFHLKYQPIVSLRGDSSEYYEVEAWHEADGESLPADQWFEKNSIGAGSSKLDRWEVLEALKALSAHRGTHPHTCLIINLDPASLLDSEFTAWLGIAIKAAEVPAETVTLQLPLEVASAYLKQAKEFADHLHGLGCGFSISRINCNGNPLGTLSHLNPSFAKLDSEISGMLGNSEQVGEQLKPLIEGLHQEQMASIMPEVQSAGTLAVLWQLGIHFIQGAYLQSPNAEMSYEFTDLA